jgi:rhodanese-related sulfurtransferase
MDITVQELKERLNAGEALRIIDVREPNEREVFHLGGELIPVGSIHDALDNLSEYKDEEIILYCRSGRRSALAELMLKEAGFTRTRNLEGGIVAWIEAFGDAPAS